MDLKQIYITIGLLGVLLLGILTFIVTTQTENNVAVPITNNSRINEAYSDLNETLYETQLESQEASNVFGNTTPTQRQLGELEVNSIVATTRIAKSIVTGLWNIFIKLPQVILGVSPVVAALISSIITILLIIGVWAIWKGAISS